MLKHWINKVSASRKPLSFPERLGLSQPAPRWVWDGFDPVKGSVGHWEVPPVEPPGMRDQLVLHSLYAELSRPEPEPTPFWRNRRPGSWWSR
jgi:hypothetical protein